MKVKQLKDLLKSHSLKRSGSKGDLIKRLATDDAARDLGEDKLRGDDSGESNFDRTHFIRVWKFVVFTILYTSYIQAEPLVVVNGPQFSQLYYFPL